LLSNFESVSTIGEGGSESPLFELSSAIETVSTEFLLFGNWLSSYSEFRFSVVGVGCEMITGGGFAAGGIYSSNLYCGLRSRGVPLLRGVSLPRSELTALIISSSKIMLLLMLTFTAYLFGSVGGGGRGFDMRG
jgi:hypothetical protein